VSFDRIEQLRAHEYVAEQLRRQIGLHLVPVGSALPAERELSAQFGVGRATVQAAVRLLEAERLVETRRGRNGGTFVVGQTGDDLAKDYLLVRLRRNRDQIIEALVFRREIEPAAAALAATHRTAEELEQIKLADQRAGEAEDDITFMAHDTEFHLAVARAAHNRYIYDAVVQMRLVLNDAITALPETPTWKRRTVNEHAKIVEALQARKADTAARAMERHAAWTQQSIEALLTAL
jgi:GntR family transcriptional repressor for pyruvate dehydrogenase complex